MPKMIITALSMSTASLMLITAMKISAASKQSLKDNAVSNLANYYEQKDVTEEYADQDFAKEVEDEFAKVSELEEDTVLSDSIPNTLTEEEKNEINVYKQENIKVEKPLDYNVVYSDLCVDVCEKAANYLTDDVYDMVINNFGEYIEKYSKIYGVDPNIIAGLIMVESPDYDINNDYDYHKIGLGQYKGEYFDNEVFKVYNYETKEMEEYEVHVENLYANPEEQIKMICITVEDSLSLYCYNPIAILEHHNKGCGSVASSLDAIMKEYGYSSREEVLKYEDPNEIFRHMPEIGDPRYSQKICYCANRCLDEQVFGDNNHQIVFYDYENNTEHVTNFSVNVMQRS